MPGATHSRVMRQRDALQRIAGGYSPGADGHAFLDPVFVGTQRTLEGERLSVIAPTMRPAREGDLGARSNSTTIEIGVNHSGHLHPAP